ncbi:MAG TPA: MFS transporter [Chloroflexia bacterium]|nr:MFS transporter [Chloroflexia bacterium]
MLEAKAVIRPVGLWRNWYIGSLLMAIAISFLGFGLVSPLRTLYARTEGASGGEVGLMAAAYLFSAFIFLFPFGWLADRYSRVGLIVGGLIAHGIITLSYMWATSGEFFITLRFVEGISSAAVLPAARALLADLVPEGRNGEAFGLMSAGMTFGMLGGPPAGTFLADGFGYTLAYILAAAIFVPAILMVLFAFRNYHPQHHSQHHAASTVATGSNRQSLPEKLWTTPVIVGVLHRIALGLGPGLAISIWSIYMADLGFGLTLIGWTYSVYAIPVLLVAPGAGRLSDRYGRLGMMFAGGLLVSLVWISYGFMSTFALFMVMGVVEGSLDAVSRSANDGYLADHTPPRLRGRAQAYFNAATQFGSLVGALLAGFLYEINKPLPFIVLGGFELALMVLALAISVVSSRRPATMAVPERQF